jgi:hypothetical protein
MSVLINNRICDSLGEELTEIRTLVGQLRPDWRNAEAFYELRSEATGAISRIIKRVNGTPLAALRSPLAAPLPAPLSLAERVFGPPAAPSERPQWVRPYLPRASRRHRYPRPPTTNKQGALW